MRNIVQEMHKDLWYRSLSILEKLAWYGMICQLADDQGRFLVDPIEMRHMVFSGNQDVTTDQAEEIFRKFAEARKIVLYVHKNDNYCQIVNWWKYQFHAKFMAKSTYPAPAGWTDCWNSGVGIHNDPSKNWKKREKAGGFKAKTHSPASSSVNQTVDIQEP